MVLSNLQKRGCEGATREDRMNEPSLMLYSCPHLCSVPLQVLLPLMCIFLIFTGYLRRRPGRWRSHADYSGMSTSNFFTSSFAQNIAPLLLRDVSNRSSVQIEAVSVMWKALTFFWCVFLASSCFWMV